MSQLLQELGHEVLVANAGQVQLIHRSDRKNDRLDAQKLARLARVDPSLLSPVRHCSNEAQAHLAVVRARDVLVRARTQLINCVRGLVKPTGCGCRTVSVTHFLSMSAQPFPRSYGWRPRRCWSRSMH